MARPRSRPRAGGAGARSSRGATTGRPARRRGGGARAPCSRPCRGTSPAGGRSGPRRTEHGYRPSSLSSRSQISLRVGNAGTAWRRRVTRDLADDRDRRGVEEVRDLGARDRRADEHAALLVDEEAARAARVAAVERPAGVARGLDVDHARPPARPPRPCAWCGPTDADLGIGEDHPRRVPGRRRRARARCPCRGRGRTRPRAWTSPCA